MKQKPDLGPFFRCYKMNKEIQIGSVTMAATVCIVVRFATAGASPRMFAVIT